MMFSCKDCDHLDKSRKQWHPSHYCYRYGCDQRDKEGYICFWCLSDKDLNTGGCGNFKHEVSEQLSMF